MTDAALFTRLETWDKKSIASALQAIVADPALAASANQRYGGLLAFLGTADFAVLKSLPAKLKVKKSLMTAWDPDTASSEVLAKVPLDEIALQSQTLAALPAWLGHLGQLTTLRFNHCRIKTCPASFGKLANLRVLDLDNNSVEHLPDTLQLLPGLEEIRLTRNGFRVPAWFGALRGLKRLALAENLYKEFPPTLLELTGLEELNLLGNHFTLLPDDVDRLTNLRVLEVSRLAACPAALDRMATLQELTLDAATMGALPLAVLMLPQLQKLSLNGWDACELPSPSAPLLALRSFSARYSNLSAVPDCVLNAPNLQALNLGSTKIEVLPPAITALTQLAELDVTGTPLARRLKIAAPIVGHAEVQAFLAAAVTGDEGFIGPAKLYAMFESRDAATVATAFTYITNRADARAAAERRYLNFIRVRLNDATASLEQLPNAALTEAEAAVLSNPHAIGDNLLRFNLHTDAIGCRLFVDVLGAIAGGIVNVDQALTDARTCKDGKVFDAWIVKLYAALNRSIELHANAYDQGWFGNVLRRLASLQLTRFELDHANLTLAHESACLREFMFLLAAKTVEELRIDIFQSTAPNLTECFWLARSVAVTSWGDVTPAFPSSPFTFERKAKYRCGDAGKWLWFKAP
jgi:hypothetical protein